MPQKMRKKYVLSRIGQLESQAEIHFDQGSQLTEMNIVAGHALTVRGRH